MKARLTEIAAKLQTAYAHGPAINDHLAAALPDRESVGRICQHVLELCFPGYFFARPVTREQLGEFLCAHLVRLQELLTESIGRAMRYHAQTQGRVLPANLPDEMNALALDLLDRLAEVRALVGTDVEAAFQNDPAASERETIVLSYPSIEALTVQRFAHVLYRQQVPLLPRMMTEIAHSRTGIDIHPGAQIGESFFIDHGTGVVIGETSRIGAHCVLYQGVGLVAWNPLSRDDDGELKRGQSNKRHPDLQDHVTVYAGATILGGDTVIGHHSVIGGNTWVTQSVEPYSVVTIKDPELNIRKRRQSPA